MSIAALARGCAGFAFTLTLSCAALAERPASLTARDYEYTDYTTLCPDSHAATPERGVAAARGYHDSLTRYPAAESRGTPTTAGVVAGLGYRDSLARFPGTVAGETPRQAVARCGTIQSDAI